MKPSLKVEIADRLSRYVAGQIELSEFHNWIIPATWDIDAEPEQVKSVVHRVQLLLAEFSNGDRTEEDLRSCLWGVLNRSSVMVVVGTTEIGSSSTSTIQEVQTPAARISVGTLSAMVPV
jgi:hypothetical protein